MASVHSKQILTDTEIRGPEGETIRLPRVIKAQLSDGRTVIWPLEDGDAG